MSRVPTSLPPCGRFNEPDRKQRDVSELWARVARHIGGTSQQSRQRALQFGYQKHCTSCLHTPRSNHGQKHELRMHLNITDYGANDWQVPFAFRVTHAHTHVLVIPRSSMLIISGFIDIFEVVCSRFYVIYMVLCHQLRK